MSTNDYYFYLACWIGGLGLLVILLELWRPARKIQIKNVIVNDLVAGGYYQAVVLPLSIYLASRLNVPWLFSTKFFLLPVYVKLGIFYFVGDFFSYWIHRFMHTNFGWRFHKWHHSPKYMYWLSSVRASLPQQFLFNLQSVLVFPLLAGSPAWVSVFIPVEAAFRNNWMHMNFTWKSDWLEKFLVTPRYHHIHHSDRVDLHDGNYGSLLSIWDRMFGTYIDPNKVTNLKFGTGTKDNIARLVLGI